jgi:Uri superfamily endonuclease
LETKNFESLVNNFPAGPGTYVLNLKSDGIQEISIGKLGRFTIQPGYYVYIGSAFGPGGLRARLRHHLGRGSKPHWHIDYLKQFLPIIEICFISGMTRYEHRWAATFQSQTDAVIPFPRFGSSDCGCPAHLFLFKTKPDLPGVLKSGGMKKHFQSAILSG